MFIILNLPNQILDNTIGNIKYRNNVVTGVVAVDNGNNTYDCYISGADVAYPNIPTTFREPDFEVGEAVEILIEYGNKEMPIIIGHAKKVAQEFVEDKINVLVSTLDAYSITSTTTYFEGRVEDIEGYENVTRRGFYYGTSTSYGSDTYSTGSFAAGSYNKQSTGLTANTTYHFQAYVHDAYNDIHTGDDKTMITGADYTLYEHNTGNAPSSWPYIDAIDEKMMQSFTATSNHNVDRISVIIGKRNATNLGTITLGIYAVDGSGLPTGSALTTGTVDGNTIPLWGSETFVDFIVTQISITDTTQYAIQITCDNYEATQYLEWGLATDAYSGGKFDRYVSSAWENYNSGNSDSRFKVYGY